MWYEFHDKSYKHKRAKWWQAVNVVTCFDSRGGLQVIDIYKVYCFRLWNLELARIAIETR